MGQVCCLEKPSAAGTWVFAQWVCDPHTHDFPLGGMPARQYARLLPRLRLPKAFPDNKSGTHDPILTDAAPMSGAPDNHVFEDILWNFLAGTAEPMTQKASPTRMALPRRLMAAQKAMDQSKAGKTLKLLVPSRVRASLWRIVKRCSGLTQEAKTPQILSIG